MDIRLNDEQRLLRETVRRWSIAEAASSHHPDETWAGLANLGIFALRLPESAGGMGATAVETALALEQLAQHGCFAPTIGQGVLVPALLDLCGAPDEAGRAGAGELRLALHLTPDLVEFGAPGAPGVAFDACDATGALALDDDGRVWLHQIPDTALATIDLTRTVVEVMPSAGVRVGARALSSQDMDRVRALALVCIAADLVGIAQNALDISVRYATEREQFGHPVGSFQALQHLLADAAVLVESARSCMWHAAWALDSRQPGDGLLAARQAKAYTGRAARTVVETAVQCHGGIGITWEHPLHISLRRVLMDDRLFGAARHHLAAIGDLRLSTTFIESDAPVSGSAGLDFGDSADESAFRSDVRTFLAAHAPGEVDHLDANLTMQATHAWHQQLAAAGLVGLSFPVQYGGRGRTPLHDAILHDELGAAGCPPAPAINHITNAIRLFGSEDQKRALLPGMLSCTVRWCQGFSEPNAGSDLAGLSTRGELVERGDRAIYRVQGQKIWTSEALWAQWCLLLLRTELEAPGHRGLSMLCVPMDTPGIEVRAITTAYGSQEFAEVFFDEAEIPSDHLLGRAGQGWEIAMALLGFERGPTDMGWTARLKRQVRDIEDGVRSGRVLASPSQRESLADAWTAAETLRLHVLRTVSERLDGSAPGPEGSIDKLLMTHVDQQINHVTLDLLGADAVLYGDRAFPGYVWSRAQSIFGGTQQIQRNIVAQRLLGLPKA